MKILLLAAGGRAGVDVCKECTFKDTHSWEKVN